MLTQISSRPFRVLILRDKRLKSFPWERERETERERERERKRERKIERSVLNWSNGHLPCIICPSPWVMTCHKDNREGKLFTWLYMYIYIYIYIYAIYMLYIIYIYTHTHNSFTIIFFLTFYSPVYLTLGLLKVGLSHSKKIYFLCFNESPLKMINLNALLVLKIFKVLIKTLWTTKNDLFKNETYI